MLRGTALHDLLASLPFRERDAFADELLGLEVAPPDAPDLPRGAVPYLPCPVDDILTMVREVPLRPSDELVDIGSGLGRVAMLVHLLSGARARGVEIQEQLVRAAEQQCAELALDDVSFIHANATDLPLDGSVFFLYAPCNGPMLASVLARIEEVARRRPVVVAAVDLELGAVPWLRARGASSASLTLYDPHLDE